MIIQEELSANMRKGKTKGAVVGGEYDSYNSILRTRTKIDQEVEAVELIIELAYCVIAAESTGRQIPIAFLEKVKDEFTKKYDGGKDATAGAKGMKKNC
ncbi:hypothetical protein RDABS01_010838 [Bienertia sinuspersici]